MLAAISAGLHTDAEAQQSPSGSKSHISGMPPPAEAAPMQSTVLAAPQQLSQEIPISPTKVVTSPLRAMEEDKQATEYTWPDSLLDVDMTSGDEPAHTTLLPDKHVTSHPEVQRALTSLALRRTIEQDRDDIMTGVQ